MVSSAKTQRHGFTMIEVALVLTVAGLMMAIGVPKAARLRRQMELDTAAHRFAQEIKAAQHEAVRRNVQVSVTTVGTGAYDVGTRRVSLPTGITFAEGTPATTSFPAFGPVVGGARRYTLTYNSNQRAVAVSAAGMVTVE